MANDETQNAPGQAPSSRFSKLFIPLWSLAAIAACLLVVLYLNRVSPATLANLKADIRAGYQGLKASNFDLSKFSMPKLPKLDPNQLTSLANPGSLQGLPGKGSLPSLQGMLPSLSGGSFGDTLKKFTGELIPKYVPATLSPTKKGSLLILCLFLLPLAYYVFKRNPGLVGKALAGLLLIVAGVQLVEIVLQLAGTQLPFPWVGKQLNLPMLPNVPLPGILALTGVLIPLLVFLVFFKTQGVGKLVALLVGALSLAGLYVVYLEYVLIITTLVTELKGKLA